MKRLVAVSVIAGATLAGCSMPEPSTAPLKDEPAASSETASAAKDKGPSSLTGTAPVGKTMSVKISGVTRDVTNSFGDPADTAFVKFTVKLTNDGDKAVDPMMLMVSCAYGKAGTAADDVYYEGMPEPPMVKVLPGKASTFTHACTLPKDETALTIQAQDVSTGETAVFEGDVK